MLGFQKTLREVSEAGDVTCQPELSLRLHKVGVTAGFVVREGVGVWN